MSTELEKLRDENKKLRKLLEIDGHRQSKNGGKEEWIETPDADIDTTINGIFARDCTIDLLKDHIKELQDRLNKYESQ